MDIDRIRQLAREQGVDLEIQGLVCLPREIKKYTRSIYSCQKKGGVVSYDVQIRLKDFKLFKSFKTEAKADKYICLTNVRENLPIRNIFTIYEDRVLVELTKGKLLICNYDDLYLLEQHTWHCSMGYATTCTSSSNTMQFFHNVKLT